MLKKFSLIFSFVIGFTLIAVNNSFAQAKKTVTKTKTVVKKAPVKKSVVKAPVVKTPVAAKPNGSIRIKITTDSGVMIVLLYDSTPLHRDNFVKLVKEGFYDSLLFHRVIAGFMIQGGDPLSKNAAPGTPLGMGGGDMSRIPAEFRKSLIHKKGALAAARDGNPEKASSACQFYIVDGKVLSDMELNSYEINTGVKYSPEQRNLYKTIGGTAMLDQNYTVFGEVESGLEVIGKIARVPKDQANRPFGDIRMHMEIIK